MGDRTTQISKTKGKILEEDQDTIEKSNRKGRGKLTGAEISRESPQFSILSEKEKSLSYCLFLKEYQTKF